MWWAALLGGLVSVAGSIAGRVLIALGVGFVSYTGLTTALDAIKAAVVSQLGTFSGNALVALGLMKVDVVVSILFSAYAARLVLQGLTSGAIKKMVVR